MGGRNNINTNSMINLVEVSDNILRQVILWRRVFEQAPISRVEIIGGQVEDVIKIQVERSSGWAGFMIR